MLSTNSCRGVAKLVKAPDFDSGMRRFESFLPSPNSWSQQSQQQQSLGPGFVRGRFRWFQVDKLVSPTKAE